MLNHTTLDHTWIAAHIPHNGSMCLLGNVLAWDQNAIRCDAVSHRDINNPLRAHGRLGAACGIEYAAQAMAVHGALLAPSDGACPRIGYLVSIRSTHLHVARLDHVDTDLQIEATSLSSSTHNILYAFSISTAGQLLLSGRATVILNAASHLVSGGATPC